MTMPPMSSTLTPHSFRNLVRAASMSIGRSCFTFRAPLHVMPSDIYSKQRWPTKRSAGHTCVCYAWVMREAMRGLCTGYA